LQYGIETDNPNACIVIKDTNLINTPWKLYWIRLLPWKFNKMKRENAPQTKKKKKRRNFVTNYQPIRDVMWFLGFQWVNFGWKLKGRSKKNRTDSNVVNQRNELKFLSPPNQTHTYMF
jgi:hypothetical protein